jgi:hypothetical protein
MAKAKVKVENYTPEQVAALKAGYTGTDNKGEVKALAASLGKSEASVRAKLAAEKVYKSSAKAEAKSDRVTKEALVEQVAAVVGLNEPEREGLYKATKPAIEKILARLATKPSA